MVNSVHRSSASGCQRRKVKFVGCSTKTSDFFSVENYCLLISIENFVLSPFGVYIACTEKGIQQERLESRNYSHQSAIYLEHDLHTQEEFSCETCDSRISGLEF